MALNLITRSTAERTQWAPVSIVLLGLVAFVMVTTHRKPFAGETLLRYVKGERFSLVLYLNQEVTPVANRDMASLTRALVATALYHGGTFYLPYQQHYTRADVARAYPEIDDFFALKRQHDASLLFRNSLYERYADPAAK